MGRRKALVLDDDRLCRTILEEMLEEANYDVSAFSSPTEVIELWNSQRNQGRQHSFDLILTDNQMPGMTGLEFLTWIGQQNCPLPDHRKAVISGSWSSSELLAAQKLGCHVFHKPTQVDSLYAWACQEE